MRTLVELAQENARRAEEILEFALLLQSKIFGTPAPSFDHEPSEDTSLLGCLEQTRAEQKATLQALTELQKLLGYDAAPSVTNWDSVDNSQRLETYHKICQDVAEKAEKSKKGKKR